MVRNDERHLEKVRENRLRRAAARQGLILRKSRRRDPRALDYGNYWLVDLAGNYLVAGGESGINLDDVEVWLTKD
jgi:hypothetical protein